MSDQSKERRLPPPAFPPGGRERIRGSIGPERGKVRGPEARAADGGGLAFISPEEPLPLQSEVEGGVVTGLGEAARYAPQQISAAGDPHLHELTLAIEKLAEALKRRGEAGLHAAPGMSRFEATLRAYCVGYLAGRRADRAPGTPGDGAPHD